MDETRQQIRRMAAASGRSGTRKKTQDYYDFSLLAVIIVLTGFGLIMLYSTTAYSAQSIYGSDMYYFRKQAQISAGCIIMAIVISRFDYHILTKFTTVLYGAALILMALVMTPLGMESHGAKRWIGVGSISFQPSEIAKIAVIVCLSYSIVKMGKQIATLRGVGFLLLMGGAQAAGAFLLTDNLSTAIIIFCITTGLIFISHPRTAPFVIAVVLTVLFVMFVVIMISRAMTTSPDFRLRRILVWLHPEDYASGDGYQTLQALYAIGSGGFFGRGLGNSIQKISSIPEAQNDMIFSIVCEEFGVFGAVLVLILFAYLLYRLIFIAQNAPDLFGSLLVSGIFIHIALQVLLNISVVVNLLPNTGVTLPFFSYGGTASLFIMAEMGLALSVSRSIRFQNVADPLF